MSLLFSVLSRFIVLWMWACKWKWKVFSSTLTSSPHWAGENLPDKQSWLMSCLCCSTRLTFKFHLLCFIKSVWWKQTVPERMSNDTFLHPQNSLLTGIIAHTKLNYCQVESNWFKPSVGAFITSKVSQSFITQFKLAIENFFCFNLVWNKYLLHRVMAKEKWYNLEHKGTTSVIKRFITHLWRKSQFVIQQRTVLCERIQC